MPSATRRRTSPDMEQFDTDDVQSELLGDEDDEVELEAASRAASKAKPVEVELRKEKIRRKALTGVAVTAAVGYVDSFAPISRFTEDVANILLNSFLIPQLPSLLANFNFF